MKILQFVKSHKLVTSAVVLAFVAGGGVAAMTPTEQSVDSTEKSAQTFTSSDVIKTLDPNSPSPVPQTPAPTESPEPVEVSPQPSPQPTVKTTQEYGLMYLDLTSNVLYQPCFDKIQQMFPERFTPEVREKNVKALRSFANVCSTAVLEAGTNRWIVSLGRNGEFFDSEQAKQFN